MKVYGRNAMSDVLGDRIIYRGLTPVDRNLPGLEDIRSRVGLELNRTPRKSETDYAQVVVYLLRTARQLELPKTSIRRLIFVGDTRLNDATAFANLCQAGDWPGAAFIGSETAEPAAVECQQIPGGQLLYLANRWAALPDFDRYCSDHGLNVDTGTAVIVDLDKTALGARGRNARVIDQARVQAVRDTVASFLAGSFNEDDFQIAYHRLNQVEFHPFTSDNQDYIAYICLVLGSGLWQLDQIIAQVQAGELTSFDQFIAQVDHQVERLGPQLAAIHTDIYTNVRAGDPTPFKSFRRNEFLTTIGRMGQLPDDAPVERLLQEEIVITQEVLERLRAWKERGALLFALSDKPDEASLPTPEQANQGFLPIHRTVTHVVGV